MQGIFGSGAMGGGGTGGGNPIFDAMQGFARGYLMASPAGRQVLELQQQQELNRLRAEQTERDIQLREADNRLRREKIDMEMEQARREQEDRQAYAAIPFGSMTTPTAPSVPGAPAPVAAQPPLGDTTVDGMLITADEEGRPAAAATSASGQAPVSFEESALANINYWQNVANLARSQGNLDRAEKADDQVLQYQKQLREWTKPEEPAGQDYNRPTMVWQEPDGTIVPVTEDPRQMDYSRRYVRSTTGAPYIPPQGSIPARTPQPQDPKTLAPQTRAQMEQMQISGEMVTAELDDLIRLADVTTNFAGLPAEAAVVVETMQDWGQQATGVPPARPSLNSAMRGSIRTRARNLEGLLNPIFQGGDKRFTDADRTAIRENLTILNSMTSDKKSRQALREIRNLIARRVKKAGEVKAGSALRRGRRQGTPNFVEPEIPGRALGEEWTENGVRKRINPETGKVQSYQE